MHLLTLIFRRFDASSPRRIRSSLVVNWSSSQLLLVCLRVWRLTVHQHEKANSANNTGHQLLCVNCFIRYLILQSISATKLHFFTSYLRGQYKPQLTPAMPQRPFNVPQCLMTRNVQLHSNDYKWSPIITSCYSFYSPRKVGSLSQAICPGVELNL